jgi:hypothetical protein
MLDKPKSVSQLILSSKTRRAFQKRYFARKRETATKAAKFEAVVSTVAIR